MLDITCPNIDSRMHSVIYKCPESLNYVLYLYYDQIYVVEILKINELKQNTTYILVSTKN